MDIPNNKADAPLTHYRALLAESNPVELSRKSGVPYDEGSRFFQTKVLGRPFFVSWPEGNIAALPPLKKAQSGIDEIVVDAVTGPSLTIKAATEDGPATASDELSILLIRKVLETNHIPAGGGFKSYAQICPTYMAAFNRRVTNRLSKLHESASDFARACEAAGGVPFENKADAAYEFEFMPEVFVRVTFYEGDDEFPAQASVLYSDNMVAMFSSEDIVYISEIIIRAMQLGYVS